MNKKSIERFHTRYDKGSPDQCWEWQGCRLPKGYGTFNMTSNRQYAHRIMYELTYGPFDKKLYVCHHCDNPPCVNPNHLFLGTAKDNTQDFIKKGLRKKLIHTPEAKRKMSEARKGTKASEETKKKLSVAVYNRLKDDPNAFKKSKKTIDKISKSHKERWENLSPEERKKHMDARSFMKGKKHSPETIKKMSEARSRYHKSK